MKCGSKPESQLHHCVHTFFPVIATQMKHNLLITLKMNHIILESLPKNSIYIFGSLSRNSAKVADGRTNKHKDWGKCKSFQICESWECIKDVKVDETKFQHSCRVAASHMWLQTLWSVSKQGNYLPQFACSGFRSNNTTSIANTQTSTCYILWTNSLKQALLELKRLPTPLQVS